MKIVFLVVSGGCINQTTRLVEVAVSGEISAEASAAQGVVTVELQHAWTGTGELRHPLGPIETFTLEGPGPYDRTLLYPEAEGEGLVVYAWMDGDGDGVLCSPTNRDEPAGLTEVADFPAYVVTADVVLDAACAGAETLFP